jgi:hypothetical protein
VFACGRWQEPCNSFRSVRWVGGRAKLGSMPLVAVRQVRFDEQLLVFLHAGDGSHQS